MPPTATLAAPVATVSATLDKRGAAAYIGCSVRTLDRLDILRVCLRGKVLYRRVTLDAWLAAQESAK